MNATSTRGGAEPTPIAAAIARGLAPDGGLFVPESLPRLTAADFADLDLTAVAARLLAPFFEGTALGEQLPARCAEALSFPVPLVEVAADTHVLELFHGPTAAFKDVGARFLAACMRHAPSRGEGTQTILVATSGDTGSAIAAAFDGEPGVEVVILYPRGRVSPRQEHQLCCWSDNVKTFRIDGSFDDCQRMVKAAFADGGTLTAGNSSTLTDGAGAVLLMSEERARALGYTPLAAFKSWSYVGVDPADQLLMGPALAMPAALERAGMALEDVSIIDMHEAFAAQVLSVLRMLGSDAFGRERLGREGAVGDVDPDLLNVYGGSVALGHPFAATGARMVTTMANELHRTGKETALLGICAAGGLGAGAVLEAIA